MIACDPNAIGEVTLPDYPGRPDTTRPAFRYRCFTAREVLDREQKFQAATNEKRLADQIPALTEALAVGLVGWSNLTTPGGETVPFDPKRISEALTAFEMVELFKRAEDVAQLVESEKKSSLYPALSAPAPSAPPANEEGGA